MTFESDLLHCHALQGGSAAARGAFEDKCLSLEGALLLCQRSSTVMNSRRSAMNAGTSSSLVKNCSYHSRSW